MATTRRVFVVASIALLLTAACTQEEQAAPTAEPTATPVEAASTIDVTLQEWAVLPSPALGASGDVTFEVSNAGEDEHEFVVASTDLGPGDLPTLEDTSVDEEQLDIAGEVEEVEPGGSAETTIALDPGSYVLFCNLVEEEEEDGETVTEVHYQLGMRIAFAVE